MAVACAVTVCIRRIASQIQLVKATRSRKKRMAVKVMKPDIDMRYGGYIGISSAGI